MAHPTSPSSQSQAGSEADERDRYASEFAELVQRYQPSRGRGQQLEWLRRIPDEVFEYYRWGILSYGRAAETPIERRGRLYLLQTALLFLWMRWGRSVAADQFRNRTEQSTQRASSLVMLEIYRKIGVVKQIAVDDWFRQPIEEWRVHIASENIPVGRVSTPDLAARLQGGTDAECSVETLSRLRSQGAVPNLHELNFREKTAG